MSAWSRPVARIARGLASTVNVVPGATDRDRGYWRDVGTLDAYHDAHMDLVSVHPIFNLYNRRWPILTNHPSLPPAKFVEGGTIGPAREGRLLGLVGGRPAAVADLQRRHRLSDAPERRDRAAAPTGAACR